MDDVSGAALIPAKVRIARQEELKYVKGMTVYDKIEREKARNDGMKRMQPTIRKCKKESIKGGVANVNDAEAPRKCFTCSVFLADGMRASLISRQCHS